MKKVRNLRMIRFVVAPLAAIWAMANSSVPAVAATPLVLYDLNFSAPSHVLGESGAVDGRNSGDSYRDKLSRINFGRTVVAESFEGLTDRPLILDPYEEPSPFSNGLIYSQVQFDLDYVSNPVSTSSHIVRFEVDIDLGNDFADAGDQLTLFVDSPTVRKIYFNHNGAISSYNGGNFSDTFDPSQPFRLEVEVNTLENIWTASIDGRELFMWDVAFEKVRAIRLSARDNNDSGFLVGIDNIQISVMPIPEPTVAALLLGVFTLSTARLRSAVERTGT